MPSLTVFDYGALIRALDGQRAERGLDWNAVADQLYRQSADLNALLADHAICQGALVRNVIRQGPMSCQYALTILRWIDCAPEQFLTGPVADVGDTRLPPAGPDARLRWDLGELHASLDQHRQDLGFTWTRLAEEFDCTPSRLTNLRQARLADLELTMRVTQRVARPAAHFIHPADW